MPPTPTRQHPRYALEADIVLGTEAGAASGRTRNLSRGGFCAVVVGEIAAGATVTAHVSLVFKDAVSEPLALSARICWVTAIAGGRKQIGASFAGLSDAELANLDMFLRYLTEDDPPDAGETTDRNLDDDLFG